MNPLNRAEIIQNILSHENQFTYHTHEEESLQYHYIREGDPRAVEEAEKMFLSDQVGNLCDDPLRNAKYMFVCAATLACRYAIEGGVNSNIAYLESGHFIRQADMCRDINAVRALIPRMFGSYVDMVQKAKSHRPYPRVIREAIEYIRNHLHEKITVADVAQAVHKNNSYLSKLFIQSTGKSISDYIRRERITVAKSLLTDSKYSVSDIAGIAGFASQSHFIQVFRQYEGCTPTEYRERNWQFTGAASEPDHIKEVI